MALSARQRIPVALLVLMVAGCARSPEIPPAKTPSPQSPPAAAPSTPRPPVNPLTIDPFGVEATIDKYASRIETSAPTKLSATEAIAVASASWRTLDSSPTFVTAREVVYSGYGIKNRLAWLVGAAPVRAQTHGFRGGIMSARGVFVVDATTGRILSESYSGLSSPETGN